ncbi:hypothetical protein PIB30_081797 [Stylosanthes scabra]|uniref:Uncharacterized protein n=1 Tax=Stylosanthes scabra TaxID=79078 RepID=A0ABU6URE5_9FABA|nr:hypothetical protein [Stylosanthes scabra]
MTTIMELMTTIERFEDPLESKTTTTTRIQSPHRIDSEENKIDSAPSASPESILGMVESILRRLESILRCWNQFQEPKFQNFLQTVTSESIPIKQNRFQTAENTQNG